MTRSSFQKAKLLYVQDFLLRCADEDHPATVRQIMAYLAGHGIAAERKSIYDDIHALRSFGLDVIQTRTGRYCGYYVGSRDFTLPELQLLMDSVQCSGFITQKKTEALMDKLRQLTNIYAARRLGSRFSAGSRAKTENETIYDHVDQLRDGIARDKKVRFRYFDYTMQKERHFRRDGAFYEVSPCMTLWDSERYDLAAYDGEAGRIRHFQVDRITDIIITDQPRDPEARTFSGDTAGSVRKRFGMVSGVEQTVQLRFDASLLEAVMDHLGWDTPVVPEGPDSFTVRTGVVVNPQFFAWIFGFGGKAQILGPEPVVQAFVRQAEAVCSRYRGSRTS